MSISPSIPPVGLNASERATSSPASPRIHWLREPLLHFVLLGAAIFAVDHALVSRADDPRTIVVGADVDKEAKLLFKAARGVEPSAKELTALRQVWLDNEVLYREGLAMKLDKGDTSIRDRVIFKALSVIDANTKLPPIDNKVLRNWFDTHRDKYDQPARFDFEEAVLTGDTSESAVRAFVEKLNNGTPGDANAGLRVFKGRPLANLVQSYGEPFANALRDAPVGQWQALASREGVRAVRLTGTVPAQPAVFEVVRGPVQQDWTDATLAEQRTAAVRALTKKYNIKYEATAK